MKYIALLAILLLTSCATITPLCRHTVLAQYYAALDAGYIAEIIHFENAKPVRGYKYHAAVRVKRNESDSWKWLSQPETTWDLTNTPPKGKLLRRLQPIDLIGTNDG